MVQWFSFGERRWYGTISELQSQIDESDSITHFSARGCSCGLFGSAQGRTLGQIG